MPDNQIDHIEFTINIDKQIKRLREAPENESYSRLVHIAKQLIEYKKKTGFNIF